MKKKSLIYGLLIIFVICLNLFVKEIPATKAVSDNSETPKNINITFTSGDKVNAFDDKTILLTANATNGYVTLPKTFSQTVTMNPDSYYQSVDDETFYFNEGDYSYTFTGWKIKGSSTYTPMNTVFQPNDIVDIESLNVNGNYEITLEAVWGKVIYLSNEYKGRYYTDYWLYDKASTTDGRYEKLNSWNYKYENKTLTLNKGRDVNNPLSGLDYAYYVLNKEKDSNYLNAYLNVIMLTDDYDYVKSSTVASGQENYFTGYDIYKKTFEDNGDVYSIVDENYDVNKHYIWGEYTAQISRWGYLSSNDWLAVTFKSLGDTNYNLYWNAFGYSDAMSGNIRFDNVNFGAPYNKKTDVTKKKRPMVSEPSSVSSETNFSGSKGNYIEFTNRNLTTGNGSYVLRPGAIETVVVNGGTFSSWQTSWSSSINADYNINWYMGATATVNGNVTLGTTASYSTTNAYINVPKFKFTMTGGNLYGNIYGSSNVSISSSSGNRIINIIGDRGTDFKTNPVITGNIYGGGGKSSLIGNSYINIFGCTNFKPKNSASGNVYGGGHYFNATLYGNSNVNISNSKIAGDVFGGGYNGNIDTDSSGNGGNINLKISNSEVTGNVFGVGMGGSQSDSPSVTTQANNTHQWKTNNFSPNNDFFKGIKNADYNDFNTDWDWSKPASGFPFLVTNQDSNEFGYLCSAIVKYITWTSNSSDYLTFGRTRTFNFMSLAYAKKDVSINITGSKIGINSTNGDGNVYGGGSLAVVYGNIDINVTDSNIYGTVYGGGDGTSKPSEITLYSPMNEEGYNPPSYVVNSNGTVSFTSERVTNLESLGSFAWSDDIAVLNMGGIDFARKLIYSANASPSLLGKIYGSTTVNLTGTTVYGNIFGGGNAGVVDNGTQLILNNVTANNNVYGGGNQASVYGKTYLSVNSSEIGGTIFGGGNAAGVIKNSSNDGSTKVMVEDTHVSGSIYGGNNEKGELSGNSEVYISGSTEVLKDVYGGGNQADIGTADTNNSKSSVNIVGASIHGDVYGGSNQSVVYGSTTINLGANTVEENLKAGNILIKGSLFGGGKSSSAGTDTYDFSYIAVKNGTTLNIDGNGYNSFNINGSIFGSGNASSSEGESIIFIKNYGSKSDIKQNISIQRATKVEIDNSFIELSGTTDRTNEFKAELFSISRVDDLILKNGTYLYFQNGTNLLKKLESLDSANNPIDKDNVINKLFVMQGKNVKITTSEDASDYGQVVGMTYLGIYDKINNGYVYGIYNETYKDGDTILEEDKNVFTEGTYVLAFHSNDYNANGFVSNFENEVSGLLSYQVINPTPTDQIYHFWKIGGDTEVIDLTLTASKYSVLGKSNSVKLQSTDPNTVYSITGISVKDYNGELINPDSIPSYYSNNEDANNLFGLKMIIEGSEWESDKEYYFLTANGGEVSSNSTFKTSNSTSTPEIKFYLKNASNISENLDKGVVTIKLSSEHRISGTLDIVQKEIIINLSINALVYEEIDYEGHITDGVQSSLFNPSSVSISPSSAFSVYFSARGYTTNNPYTVGEYHRSLVSNMVFPAGTKIIMSDVSNSKIVDKSSQINPTSYYYVVTEEDETNGISSYRLDKFIKMGTYNANEHYSDTTNYYNDNFVSEDFIFSVNFEDCLNKPSIGNGYTIYIENKNNMGEDIISANGSTIQSVRYDIVEDTTNFSINALTLDKESYYTFDKMKMNIEINSKDKTIDTNLQNKNYVLGVTLLKEDTDGLYQEVNANELIGTKFIVDDKVYNIDVNGHGKFIIFDNIVDLKKDVVIDISDSKLNSGNYKLKVDVLTSTINTYTNNVVASSVSDVVSIKKVKYGLNLNVDDQDRIIKKNGVTMKDNKKLVVNAQYSSNLSNPHIKVMATNNNGEYISLSNFITDEVKITDEGYSYKLISVLSDNMEVLFNLKNNLTSGSYYLVFKLYDSNNYIGEDKINFVVKK